MSYTNMPRQPRMTHPGMIPQGQGGGHSKQRHTSNYPSVQHIAPGAGYAQVPQYYFMPPTAQPGLPGVYYSSYDLPPPPPTFIKPRSRERERKPLAIVNPDTHETVNKAQLSSPTASASNRSTPPSASERKAQYPQPTATATATTTKHTKETKPEPTPEEIEEKKRQFQAAVAAKLSAPAATLEPAAADKVTVDGVNENKPVDKPATDAAKPVEKMKGSSASCLTNNTKQNLPDNSLSMKNVTYSTHVLSRKTSKVDGQDLSHTLSQEAGTRRKVKSKSYDRKTKQDRKENHGKKFIAGKAEIDIGKLVDEYFSCPICMDVVQLRIPPCQHFICKVCLEKDDELCERQSCDRPIDLRCLKCKKYLCYRCSSREKCKVQSAKHDCQEILDLQSIAERNFEAWKTRLATRQLDCQTAIDKLLTEIADNKSLLDYAVQTWEDMKHSVTGRINLIDELGVKAE